MFGFVYIWFDRKKKRYYVGSHWGTLDDGYVCSSVWMNCSYKNRKHDFKRRIIAKVTTNRQDLLEEESKWLALIKPEELRKRYYNLRNVNAGHWMAGKNAKTIKQKISIGTKEAMARPDVRENYLKGLETRDTRSDDPKVRAKRAKSMKGKNVGKVPVEHKNGGKRFTVLKDDPRILSGELIIVGNATSFKMTEEQKIANRERCKENTHFHKLNSMIASCKYCGKQGNPGNIGRYHNEKCKLKVT